MLGSTKDWGCGLEVVSSDGAAVAVEKWDAGRRDDDGSVDRDGLAAKYAGVDRWSRTLWTASRTAFLR